MPEECANPLLLGWIKEWWDLARERNSKGATVYKKAYDSMKACPLTFNHPSEAQQLFGLGPKLCSRLADKLKEHCEANGLPMPSQIKLRKRKTNTDDDGDEEAAPEALAKRPRKTKPYVPTLRSGAYALILALSSVPQDSSQGLTKGELIEKAQPHCDASFTAPSDPSSFYTAWASMKTLQNKDFIYEKSRPLRRYFLTDEGWDVAKRIQAKVPDNRGVLAGQVPARTEPPASDEFLDLEDDSLDDRPSNGACDGVLDGPSDLLKTRSMAAQRSRHSGQTLGAPPEDRFGTYSTTSRSRTPPRARVPSNTNLINLLSSPESPGHKERPPNRPQHPRSPPKTSHAALTALPNALPSNPSVTSSAHAFQESTSNLSPLPSIEPIKIPSGAFTLRLTLDTREIRAKHDRDYISNTLSQQHSTPPIVQSLPLGDVAFIAKLSSPTLLSSQYGEEPGDEVFLLDYILERKRLDDLIYSIKDGRFHEQKFRLRKSGVRNVIYLVEDVAISSEHASKYGEAVQSAIASTQVVDGWSVIRTKGVDETIRYLARLTNLLKGIYENKPLYLLPTRTLSAENYLPLLTSLREKYPDRAFGLTAPTFSGLCSKNEGLNLRDMFLKMLMCTRGMSGEKAIEVQRVWSTPRGLVEALEKAGKKENEEDADADADADAAAEAAANGKSTSKGKKGKEVNTGKGDMLFQKLGEHPVPRWSIGRELSRKVAGIWGE